MKKILVFLFCILISLPLFASPIGKERAAEYAREFYKDQNGNTKSDVNPRQIYPLESTTKGAAQSPVYMFTFDNAKGFVVLSGDDRLTPVLGYSLSSDISIENMPPQMYSWIKWYEYQINQILSDNVEPNTSISVKNLSEIKATEVVAPLLGNISYNQGNPYNLFTPHPQPEAYNYRTYTGCVATAIAQILRYKEYPARGMGNVNYTTRTLGLSLSADLSSSIYDYNKILPSYKDGTSYTTEQAEAVATLIRDVGYAANMDYGYNASGAYGMDASKGLIDHFGYSPAMRYLRRNYIEDRQWIEIIKMELDANSPLYYSGYDAALSVGHAFVCDGYNDASYFHFNWGWDGFGDGWYIVDHLVPIDLGTGAGNGDYSYYQDILWGMQPAKEGDKMFYQMLYDGYSSGLKIKEGVYNKKDASIPIMANGFWNYSLDALNGECGIVIFREKEYIQSLSAIDINLDVYYGYNQWDDAIGENISSLSNGKYRIMLAFFVGSDNIWQKVLAPLGGIDEYALEVTDTAYTISLPSREEQIDGKDLIISRYIGNLGYNRAIQLYNGTNQEIDLSAYSLRIQFDGNGDYANELNLSGILPAKKTYLISHSLANFDILSYAKLKLPKDNAFINFDGNDAIALFKNGIKIDEVGIKDQVSAWGYDMILRRKCNLSEYSNVFDALEWNAMRQNDFSDVGSHCSSKPDSAIEYELPLISDLIISEYIGIKGYDKAIELYNRSGKNLDLSKYSLKRQDGGNGIYANEVKLRGSLPDGGIYIIAHENAIEQIALKADMKLPNSGFMTFDGDDVIGLFKQGELIDVIGTVEPKDWGGDEVMIRHCTTAEPSTTYNEDHWGRYGYNYFSDLGYYCGIQGDTVETTLISCSNIRELRTKEADGETIYKLTNMPEITAIGGGVRNQKYIQDATAAILVDDTNNIITGSYKVGDKIKDLTGTLSVYSGIYQFVPIKDATKETGTATVTHREISLSDLQNKSKMDELQSQLIKINKVFFADSGIFANGAQYKLTDGSITDELFKVHIHNADYVGKPIPNKLDTVNLVGLAIFDGSKYYISPRFYDDFTLFKCMGNESSGKYAPMCEVYPNPVSDVLNIIAINASGYSPIEYNSIGYNSSTGYKIEILNLSSSKVKEYYWKELNGSIDVSDLVPGMYFLKISSLNQNMLNIFKIVKK